MVIERSWNSGKSTTEQGLWFLHPLVAKTSLAALSRELMLEASSNRYHFWAFTHFSPGPSHQQLHFSLAVT